MFNIADFLKNRAWQLKVIVCKNNYEKTVSSKFFLPLQIIFKK